MTTTIQITNSFGKAAHSYDEHCSVQVIAARTLANKLEEISSNIPNGPYLELACGTGIFTSEAKSILDKSSTTISDISAEMVAVCAQNVELKGQNIVLDAQLLQDRDKFALICCAFGAQWFENINATFERISDALIPGGFFIFSLPTKNSFPEWKQVCVELGVTYSANQLPDAESVKQYWHQNSRIAYDKNNLTVETICVTYPSSLDFFKSLKGIGAHLRVHSQQSDRHKDTNETNSLRSVIHHWDKTNSTNGVDVTYEVLYGVLQKQ